MNKKTWYSILLALCGVHLALVACGASYIEFDPRTPFGRFVEYYGEMSGSNKSYGFFAPGVGSEVRTWFEVLDHEGHSTQVSLQRGTSHEADLRIGNIFESLGGDEDRSGGPEARRKMAASLAGKVFGRNPQAVAVVVHVDEFEPLNMPEYRAGKRPHWQEIYTAKFEKAAEVKS